MASDDTERTIPDLPAREVERLREEHERFARQLWGHFERSAGHGVARPMLTITLYGDEVEELRRLLLLIRERYPEFAEE